ncbi:Sporulation protein YabP [uncultured Eubacteriales bacterium]|uniref:Sporulation protein YabP n=1 Tax=uncultured Eubacteriales bacterium TaxID=172733 RepID=A0A212IYH1_9FIRM|nr:Sporulation protein YabP [uncultured Eubacteriales bacterium]
MPYEEKSNRPEIPHHLILEGREQLSVSGVEEVESFDENQIVMYTSKGALIVRGEGLHIEKLSLDGGDLKVEGVIESLTYEESQRSKGGFLSRLFR